MDLTNKEMKYFTGIKDSSKFQGQRKMDKRKGPESGRSNGSPAHKQGSDKSESIKGEKRS